MRVIAGKYKGRRLKSVQGKNTRPTTDRVKEAVFHMIGPFFDGGVCLDLFAGSGALGIEAISRGMDQAIFVEHNGNAIRTIHSNIKEMTIKEQSEILRMDALRALQHLSNQEYIFNLIIIDPPYHMKKINQIIDDIIRLKLLTNKGIILCEHDPAVQLSDRNDLRKIKTSTYGATSITIYENKIK